MGGFFTKAINKIMKKKELMILLTGLDFAGKTTLLYKLKLGEINTGPQPPWVLRPFNEISYKNITIREFDAGGSKYYDSIQIINKHFSETQALIFVVDGADTERLNGSDIEHTAKSELHRIMNNDKFKNAALLIFNNKQDLDNHMDIEEIYQGLELKKIEQPWFIHNCCCPTGDGLYEGLDWLSNTKQSRSYKHKYEHHYNERVVSIGSDMDLEVFFEIRKKSIVLIMGWCRENYMDRNLYGMTGDLIEEIHRLYKEDNKCSAYSYEQLYG